MSEHQHDGAVAWQDWVMDRIREHGGTRSEHLKVDLHIDGPIHLHLKGTADAGVLQQILANTQEIIVMSGTLADQLAAAQAATAASLDAISTDVTEIGADVDSLLATMTPGTTITQAMVDNATSISTRVSAVKDGLDVVNAKVPPVTPTP